MPTYAVTGATGHFGRLAVDALLNRGIAAQDLVAVVRTPSKAADLAERGVEVRAGDYDRPDTLAAALAGVDALLLVSGSEVGQRLPQHTAVIEAAKTAGVARIVYTSILKADTSTSVLTPEHLATEQALQASGLLHTILRNGWYFENYTARVVDFVAHGEIVGAAGDTAFSPAARADYAAAAAVVLTEDGHDGSVYELGGDSVTMADIAAEVTTASGTQVTYRNVDPAELKSVFVDAGVPAGYADVLVDIDRTTAAGELKTDSGDLPRLLGGPLTPLSQAVKAAL